MKRLPATASLTLTATLLLVGCGTISNSPMVVSPNEAGSAEATQAVSQLLAKSLTADTAARVAILNDRQLLATFESGATSASWKSAQILKRKPTAPH